MTACPKQGLQLIHYLSPSTLYPIFLKDFIDLFVRERAQAGGTADRGRGRSRLPTEQGAQHRTRSLSVTQGLSHPGIPITNYLKSFQAYIN